MEFKKLKLFLLCSLSLSLINCSKSDVEKVADLKVAVQEKDNSQNFEEWHQGLEKMNRIAFDDLSDADGRDLCTALSGWETDKLVSIEEFLKTRSDIHCYGGLVQKINNFNASNTVSSARRGGLNKCGSGDIQATLGPSQAVVLDTRGGLKLVTADLPRCHVGFTFDDGPHGVYTQKIFKVLEAQNVTANYFTVGNNVDRLPGLVREMENRGHIWGNHTRSHANLPNLGNSSALSEIRDGFLSLFKVSQQSPIPPFFRFPYGAGTSYLRGELRSRNVAEFFWNMDSLDWKHKNADVLYRNVLKEIEREKRGILLFHDVHAQTYSVLPRILEDLRLANYTTVFFVAKDPLRRF